MTIGVGVIGYGYWGPNLVRNFGDSPRVRVVAVADSSPARLEAASRRHPGVAAVTDATALIEHPGVDAVVIATPVHTHHPLAMTALRAGKHVLVEKPIATSSAEAMELIREAADRGLQLMVDHTFAYTAAVRKIRDLLDAGELGRIYYYDSVRVNLGLFQSDVNVLWDLAVHDLSIMDVLLPSQPFAVSAQGVSHVAGQPENIAYMTLRYAENLIAHLHVNWLAPVKIRRTLIGCADKMVVYDDLEPSEKVKVYDKGARLDHDAESKYRVLVSYRNGDLHAPHLKTGEALATEVDEFVDAIESGKPALTDGWAGLRVVRILEAAETSLREEGRLVPLGEPTGATV